MKAVPDVFIQNRVLFCLLILLSGLPHAVGKEQNSQPKIAIIIDDLGYRFKEGRQTIDLGFPLTLAIIPSSPHAERLAGEANCQQNKELLVHMPMTPSRKIAWEAGLTEQMDEEEFTHTAEQLLAGVPFAIGVNNHGGSQLTRDRQRMDWLMALLERKDLFFVDSRTTSESTASEAAASANIPYTVRDVFLDNERTEAAINKQLDKLVNLATRHGRAIAIGHPYKETLKVLKERLGAMESEGFELVGISELLQSEEDFVTNQGATIQDAGISGAVIPGANTEENRL